MDESINYLSASANFSERKNAIQNKLINFLLFNSHKDFPVFLLVKTDKGTKKIYFCLWAITDKFIIAKDQSKVPLDAVVDIFTDGKKFPEQDDLKQIFNLI